MHAKKYVSLLTLLLPTAALGYTKSGNIFGTDGSQFDVIAAIGAATDGDKITIPEGTFTWGAGGSSIGIGKSITLEGAGIERTVIQLSPTGPTGNNAVLRLTGGPVVRGFTILAPATGNRTTPFSTSTRNGWRITEVKYDARGMYSYFVRVLSSGPFGLIDRCDVIGGGGTNELIFAEGPDDSWQTPNSFGTADNLFVEDCTISGSGYVCDINNNGRAVLRYNTIQGSNKIDGHGFASNSKRGVRHMEVYNNHWSAAAGSWVAMEFRGGGLRVFANRSSYRDGVSVFRPVLQLTDYGATSNAWANFGNRYQTPINYPIKDQIGTGIDSGDPEPAYLWDNLAGLVSHAPGIDWRISSPNPTVVTGKTDGKAYPAGSTTIGVSSQSTTVRTSDYIKFAGDPNYYAVATHKTSGAGVLTIAKPGLVQSLPATETTFESGSNILYQQQTQNQEATYTIENLIAADRDYFKHTYGEFFDGSSGVGIGTKAQMNAIQATKVGVGFWVTDEGEWNSLQAGLDGQLYVWNGFSWILKYKPYTYPHPQRSGGNSSLPPTNLTIKSP